MRLVDELPQEPGIRNEAIIQMNDSNVMSVVSFPYPVTDKFIQEVEEWIADFNGRKRAKQNLLCEQCRAKLNKL
jgi:hypothetical protein